MVVLTDTPDTPLRRATHHTATPRRNPRRSAVPASVALENHLERAKMV